jgi:hypothetical protein
VSKKNRPPVSIPGLDELEEESGRLPGSSIDTHYLHPMSKEHEDEGGFIAAEYPLTVIEPDFYQGRGGVLPRNLAFEVIRKTVSHLQALETWTGSLVEGTPEHDEYLRLVSLKESIRSVGLLHPIHIYMDAETKAFRILAGERRYWAFWLLRMETGEYETIPAVIHAEPSRFLQITENEEVEPLSTIGRSRQVAIAYLETLGIFPPTNPPASEEEYWGFYRQALLGPEELLGQKRLPDNFWPQLEEKLGMHRVSMLGLLSLLRLPEASLQRADKWRLNQSQIEAVLTAPEELQEKFIDLAVSHLLPAPELKRLARLASMPGRGAFEAALRDLENPRGDENKYKRRQRPPIEVQMTKMFNTFRAVEKVTGGDFRGLARLIVANKPKEAGELCKQLEAAAAALRTELESTSDENDGESGATPEGNDQLSDLQQGDNL